MTKIHPDEVQRFILDSAVEANILPITSRCDSHCLFCSHKNNPPDITAISIGVRSVEEITRTLAFLDPDRVIAIGESATPVIEGEPFSHPAFREIIALARRVFPHTPMEVTTNGRFLTRDMVEFLEAAGNISLNVSLNSASAHGRKLLMGDTPEQSGRTIAGVELLSVSSVRFSGSLVAMPNVTGWEDIRDTVAFLARNRAAAVRVIVPAFSSWARPELVPDEHRLRCQLGEFVRALSAETPCPVLIEPSRVSDLRAVVSGVVKDSPAWNAGIRRDDVLLTINGRSPRCRVEAWQWLLPKGEVHAEVERAERAGSVVWTNRIEGDAGITMEYDFDPVRAEDIRRSVMACPGRSVLLTSELGHTVIGEVLELMDIGRDKAESIKVINRTFGGIIGAAGLLTVDDYLESYIAWRDRGQEPSQMIVPLESFDCCGFDLRRRHFSDLQRRTGVPVILK